jgi:hypothetical protein
MTDLLNTLGSDLFDLSLRTIRSFTSPTVANRGCFLRREASLFPGKPGRVVLGQLAVEDQTAHVVPIAENAAVPVLPVFRNLQVGEIIATVDLAPMLEITVKVTRVNNDAGEIL